MFNLLEKFISKGLEIGNAVTTKSREKEMTDLFNKLCAMHDLPMCNYIGFFDELCMLTVYGKTPLMGYTNFDNKTITFNMQHITACNATKDSRIEDIYDYTVRHEFRHWMQMHCLPKELYTNAYAVAALEQDAEAFGIGIVQDMAIVESNIKMAIGAAIA